MEKWRIDSEKRENPSLEVITEIMRAQGDIEGLEALLKSMEVQEKIHRVIQRAERLHMLGLNKDARKIIDNFMTRYGVRICDISSKNGIPDYVWVRETLEKGISFPDGHSEYCLPTDEDSMRDTIMLVLPFLSMVDTSAPVPKIPVRQALLGRCNTREETKVKQAACYCGMELREFVTKTCLYMARFINRYRRNEQGHHYHLGEAYLFMEHGVRMQEAFTPDEVTQAMEKVGISGSRIADDLMAELERMRNARMNPAAGSTDVPE